jgi:hypothetical protein
LDNLAQKDALTVADVLKIKASAEQEIAAVIQRFQEQTGLAVSGVSHYVSERVDVDRPSKVIRANLHVELK